MLNDKRALIGNILLAILIIIVLIGAVIGITAYQAYSFYKVIQTEGTALNNNIQSLQNNQDCSKIQAIEASAEKIKSEATSACRNPIIKIAVDKMEQIPVKCGDLNSLTAQMQTSLTPIKEYCANQTKSK